MLRLKSISQYCRIPAQCVLCSTLHRDPGCLCRRCLPFIDRLKTQCQHCAIPLPDSSYQVCGACIKQAPVFRRAHANVLYCDPFKGLLHRYKYQEQLPLAKFFIALMAADPPDFIEKGCIFVPVPVHPKKLRQRGFNPTAEIAKGLARRLRQAVLLTHCRKIRPTPPQASLDIKARRRNLAGCFAAAPSGGQRVVIIDDLLTSGSTASELARSLYAAGAQDVFLWCLARARLNLID